MNNIIKTSLIILAAALSAMAFTGCHKADSEFVHTDNLINHLYMTTSLQGTQYAFTIEEFDAKGVLVTDSITAERVAGGYGLAHIEFPLSQKDEIDLTQVFLQADVSYDVIVTPGLVGRHNIIKKNDAGEVEGVLLYATGGNGKVRKYRVTGSFI